MRDQAEQRKTIEGFLPQTPLMFGQIESVNEADRLLKVIIEPWGTETGWCKVLKDTFYPIPDHPTHAPHVEPDGTYYHDEHTTHEPTWPYKPGQEVLVGVVQGSRGTGQYVVLGLIDQGPVSDQ
jgi:hypothetical protein